MHVIAAKAICFKEAMSDEFKAYQAQVVANAREMAKGSWRAAMRLSRAVPMIICSC